MKFSLSTILALRSSRQALFLTFAIVMITIIAAFAIFGVNFLARNVTTAFEISGRGVPEQRFDIKGFEALKLESQ